MLILDREWLKEVASITMIYMFNTMEILTGYLAVQLIPFTELLPWILILFPIFLTIRGATSGAFIGNLTTLLHIGTILPRFRDNSDEYYLLAQSIFLFSVTNALLVSLFISVYIFDFFAAISAFILILFVFALAITFSLTLTSVIGFTSFKKGLDPDVVVYPVMSTMNDVAILIIFLVSLICLEPWNPRKTLFIGVIPSIIILLLYIFIFKRIRRTEIFREIFKESYITIIYSLVLSTISGMVLTSITSILSRIPTILTVLPALMTTMGDVGSITASTFTTKLRISGLSESPIYSTLRHFIALLPKLSAPFLLFSVIVSFLSSLLNLNLVELFLTLTIILLAGFITIAIIGILSTLISIIAFIYGINPDNVAIPIITATADFITIIIVTIIVKSML